MDMETIENAILRQYENFLVYRRLCELRGVNERQLSAIIQSGELFRVPAIRADAFKQGVGEFRDAYLQLNLPIKEAPDGVWTFSSATSGNPSRVLNSPEDINKYVRRYEEQFARGGLSEIVLMASPKPRFMEERGADRFKDKKDPREQMLFATPLIRAAEDTLMKEDGEALYLMDFSLLLAVASNMPFNFGKWLYRGPTIGNVFKAKFDDAIRLLQRAQVTEERVMIGPSIIITYMLASYIEQKGLHLEGINGILITGTGGYDGRKGSAVAQLPERKADTLDYVLSQLGFVGGPETVFDIYGTTESGIVIGGSFNSKLGDFVYEVTNPGVKMYVLNPETNRPVKEGERGCPIFFSEGRDYAATAAIMQADTVQPLSLNPDGSVATCTRWRRDTSGAGNPGCLY